MIYSAPFGFEKLKTIQRDGPASAYAIPYTAANFTTLGITAPQSLYPMQASAGNLTDVIGSTRLTAAGGPAYRQQALSTWARCGAKFTSTGGMGFFAAAGVGPNPTATSVALLAYVYNPGVGAIRDVMGIGGSTGAIVRFNGAGAIQIICNGVVSTGGGNHADGLLHPILLVYNRTAGSVVARSNLSSVTGVYAAISDGNKGFGSLGATASCPGYYLWGLMASGATAEGYGAATLTALGW